MFSPEWGPESFVKSSKISQSFQSLVIQCAVIAKNPWPFEDVHVSKANEILPGIFYDNMGECFLKKEFELFLKHTFKNICYLK